MIRATAKYAVILTAVVIGTASCTKNAGDVTRPTGVSLFAPQYGGNWIGNATLTGVTPVVEGECVVPAFQERVVGAPYGNESVTLAVTQDDNALVARLASATTGLACTYNGTTELNTVALDAATCDAPMLLLRCTNQVVRRMVVVGSTIQGPVFGGRLNGTLANAYNVFEDGGSGVTRVTLHYQFSVAKP
jgi:hypothetical protein